MILKAHVDEVLVEGGRASGVRLSNGKVIRAHEAVVCPTLSWEAHGSIEALLGDMKMNIPIHTC